MRWPDWLLVVTGLLYLAAAVGYWREGPRWLSLAFAGYALANVGLVMAAVSSRAQ